MIYSGSFFMILMSTTCLAKGATPVILSPSGVAPVCSGGQLELACTTAGGFQEWDFHISENMTAATYGRLVNNQAGLIIMPIVTESITFNISRVSLPERLPLVSKLSIITERSTVNGTEVNCTCIDVVTNAALSTIVSIIRENSVLQDHPVVNITWALEQSDNGSTRNVTLTWTESVNPALFSYHVFITPDAPYTFAETRLTIEILLGITYNVSIVAAHICGQTTPIATTGLFYPDCGGQFNDVNLLGIINYLNPGDRNVTFRDCPPATTPMDHEGATTYFITTDFGNDHTINDAIILALVFSFLLTLVFTFIVGFLCGVFFIKKCKKPDKATGSPTPQHIALYEEVSSRDIEQREKAVEFEQNIAYASINN